MSLYMNASYPCVNFIETPGYLKLLRTKGLIVQAFAVCIHTENQIDFYAFVLRDISVLIKLLTGVPAIV